VDVLETDADALARVLDRVAMTLRRALPPTASSSTITALDRLATEGPLRITELAAREAMTQPGVTLLVNRLVAGGHVERTPDPADGRATLVRITPAGQALLDERNAARARLLHELMARLEPWDRDRLLAALPALERLQRVVRTDSPNHTESPNDDGNTTS